MSPGPLMPKLMLMRSAILHPHWVISARTAGQYSARPNPACLTERVPIKRGGGERNMEGGHNACWPLGSHFPLLTILRGRNCPPCLDLRHFYVSKLKVLSCGPRAVTVRAGVGLQDELAAWQTELALCRASIPSFHANPLVSSLPEHLQSGLF